jgi:hypothetical protein
MGNGSVSIHSLLRDAVKDPEESDFMRYSRPGAIMLSAFLDTISCAALFGKKRWPGAPTELIDSRTVEEYLASGEFEEAASPAAQWETYQTNRFR